MKYRRIIRGILAALGMGILILDSASAMEGARQGVELCIRSLIPSLFPFFVLSSLMTNSAAGTDNPILRPLGKLLGIPRGCESLLVPGFLGGYPAGAQCIGQSYSQGHMSREQAQGMLLFCSNAGPSFLFGLLGPLFPQRRMLWELWGIHILSACFCGWIFSHADSRTGSVTGTLRTFPEILAASVQTMGIVCGWVVVFRVILYFCQRWFLWLLPPTAQVLAAGLLELSNGCLSLSALEDLRLRFVTASVLLAFGGLCVAMQTSSVIRNLSILPYCISKLFQSVFSLFLSVGIRYRKPVLFPVLLLFCILLKKTVAFRKTMVYNGSINLRRNPYAVSKENRPRLRILSPGHPAGRAERPLHQKGTARTG